jgi:LAS superfamily LD-carboxypeptidase LdcB
VRSARRYGAAVTSIALLVTLIGPTTAAQADDEHPPTAQPTPTAPGDPPADESLTSIEELERQAQELAQQVKDQQAAVAAEKRRLASAEAAAAQTLQDYQLAQRQADEAARHAEQEAQRLVVATARTEAARAALNAYVGGLYRQGMHTQRMSVYNSLIGSRGPEAFLNGLSLAERVGTKRGGEMVQLAEAQLAQQQAEDAARVAQQAAAEATAAAAAAKELADAVVDQAAYDVLSTTESLLRTQGAAAAAQQKEAERRALMAKAEEIARQRASIPYAAIEGALLPRPSADCLGRDLRGYPNGRLPSAALCPLWGTNGQMLRADAAASFNQMSRAYAQHFGSPICVTDSYRTYDEQVAVKEIKPDLAAVPGTSNHGWAMAVDLCDGVQTFGTATHDWMRRNSLRYGWFLPAWAMPGGSKPEPWHWEYAG